MPIDPSIPLSVNIQPPDPARMMSLADMGNQMRQRQQQVESQNALRSVFSNPASMDKDGNLKPEALQQVMSVDPQTGMKVQQNQLYNQQVRMHIESLTSDKVAKQMEFTNRVKTNARLAYEEALSGGAPPPQAMEIGQKVLSDGITDMKQSGLYPEDHFTHQQFNPKFDPNNFARDDTVYMQWKTLKDREADRKATQARQERQDKEQQARDKETKEYHEAEIGLRTGGKWEILTDPGNKDPQGNPTQYRYNPETSKATTLGGEPYTPTGAAKMGQAPAAGDEASIDQTAKMIAGYQMAPLTSFAMRSPWGQSVMAKVSQMNPDYQGTRYTEVNRALTAFGSGKQGDVTRSMNVGIQHLDSIDELGRALKNGDTRIINSVANRIKEELGVPAPVTFDAAKQIVADEIVKAIVGYSGAVNDRESMQAKLNRANSPAQLMEVTKEFRTLMAGQLRGLKKQYEDATGFKSGPFSFGEKLLPTTKRELGLVEGEGKDASATPDATGKSPFPQYPDAKQAGDGKWYVKKDDKWFRIE